MQISDFSTRRPEQVLILCWFRNTTECCDPARMLRVQQQQRPSSFADAFLCSYKVNAEQNVTWNCTSNKMSRSTTFNNLLDGHQLMTFNITVYYFMEINLLKWSSFIESLSWQICINEYKLKRTNREKKRAHTTKPKYIATKWSAPYNIHGSDTFKWSQIKVIGQYSFVC